MVLRGVYKINERLRELRAKTRALQRLPYEFWVHRTADVFYQTPPQSGTLPITEEKQGYPQFIEEMVLRGV